MPLPPDIAIRPFRQQDAKRLADLHRRAILAMAGNAYDFEMLQRWALAITPLSYADALAEGQVIEVAVDSADTPCAFCSHTNQQIKGLYVDPRHQGRGIGAALLDRAEQALAKGAIEYSRVTATLPAAAFYRHHGYREVKKVDHPTRSGATIPAVVLEKRLP